MVETISEGNIEKLSGEKISLLDLEGTLTHVKRKVPESAEPRHMKSILNGESIEGEVEIGYWTGLHLLAGEPPEEYYERMECWEKGEITTEVFEKENTKQWNKLVEKSDFDAAGKFLEWYNESFLNLRPKAGLLIERLQEEGFMTGIISHTSTSLSIHAAEELGADFVVPTWNFNFEQGEFAQAGMEKYAEEKSHIIEDVEELDTEEILFFGNGANDVEIAEKADKGFLVDNKGEVDYSRIKAFTGNFEEIVKKTEEVIE